MTRPTGSFRLVTYNIHKGIGGVDRRYRPERILDVLEHAAADLVFLQEVDEGVPRSRGHRQVDLIGDALEYPYRAFFPNVRLRRGHYGNAILSRWPFDHASNLDLTRPLKKRRSALHLRLTPWHRRRLWLFNLHLGLAAYERRAQLHQILESLETRRPFRNTGVIVGGDLNDVWGRLGPGILEPAGFRSVSRPAATFPAIRPLRALDRIFVRGPLQLDRCQTSRLRLAREASDHRPLIADLSFTD